MDARNQVWTRRSIIAAGGAFAGASALCQTDALAQVQAPQHSKATSNDTRPAATVASWPAFPHHAAELIAEVVGKSHSNEARVREILDAHPTLANAWWDWGFGDWESALGAASHTGRRSIALLLLERGARLDIFAAAMLGLTDVVRAMIDAMPGVQRTLGPHGITLAAHARAGGKEAEGTAAYLATVDGADSPVQVLEIADAERKQFVGVYEAVGTSVRFECKLSRSGPLVFAREGGSDIRIHRVGEQEFFPAGAPTTRFRFDIKARTLRIDAGPWFVDARQVVE